jgi:excisionase family DNA binding protein
MARASKESTLVVEPRCLNIGEAAAYLAATVWYMRSMIWERRIPFAKRGNKYVFDKRDLDSFIEAQKTFAR